jgi:hypothetical protein
VGTKEGASVGEAVGDVEGLAVGDAERKEWRKINRQMKYEVLSFKLVVSK